MRVFEGFGFRVTKHSHRWLQYELHCGVDWAATFSILGGALTEQNLEEKLSKGPNTL